MTLDYFVLLYFWGRLIFYGLIIRWVLRALSIPFFNLLDNLIVSFRKYVSNVIESIWIRKDNLEVYFVSRLAGPFAVFYAMYLQLWEYGTDLGSFYWIQIMLGIVNFFVILNVTPTFDDLSRMWEASRASKFAWLLKISLLTTFIHQVSPILIFAILIIPFSTLIDYKRSQTLLQQDQSQKR